MLESKRKCKSRKLQTFHVFPWQQAKIIHNTTKIAMPVIVVGLVDTSIVPLKRTNRQHSGQMSQNSKLIKI